MYTRIVKPRRGPTLLVRPLRRGDTDTVGAMFERLGERSRRARFNGLKPRLSGSDLELLAAADANHHVLVAYVPGDPRPAAITRGSSATERAPRSPSRSPTSSSIAASALR